MEQYGPNEIEEREEPVWQQILRRFWGPIPWMIEIAAILSALVQKWEDFMIIMIMLLVNAGIDFAQEHRAMNAVKALKQRLASQALVLRDGNWLQVAAKELFLFAALASREEHKDPIEVPIFNYIDEHFSDLDLRPYAEVHFEPFNPTSKRAATTVEKDGAEITAIKGAPQVVIKLAGLSADKSHILEGTVQELAGKGYRTLAVAKQQGADVELIGLIPLIDSPRDDSAEVIRDIRTHGISVKMVTGDNIAIAREIGTMLRLTGWAYRAKDFQEAGNRGFVE